MTQGLNEKEKIMNEKLKIAYLCDGEGCAAGSGHCCLHTECTHTFDIHHAKNFKMIGKGTFFEEQESEDLKEETDGYNN